MQEPVTPRAVVAGMTAGGSSAAAEEPATAYMHPLGPRAGAERCLNNLPSKEEAPPPLQTPTLKDLGIVLIGADKLVGRVRAASLALAPVCGPARCLTSHNVY
jgi:hypothetical protein